MRSEGSGGEDAECVEFWSEEMGRSLMMERRVSAATMPPMEWPTSMVLTDASTVGEGVWAATSRSMTLFRSLFRLVLLLLRGC
jgi:hypothetical protein